MRIVVLLNKWDLLPDDHAREQMMETVERRMGMAKWANYLRISALTGRSVERSRALVDSAAQNRSARISTSKLNQLLTDMREFGPHHCRRQAPPAHTHVTQTGTNPPAFTFFVSHTDLIDDSYRRYIENRMRATFDFQALPFVAIPQEGSKKRWEGR